MAAGDATPVPVKNQAYRITFPILDADGDLVTGAASLDSEVSKDGGTFADCTNEATEIATSSGMYYLDLTATEMNADTVAVIVKTGTAGAKTTPIVMYPQTDGADLKVDVTHIAGSAVSTTTAQLGVNVVQISADATAADNAEAFFDGTGYAGTNNVIPTVTTLTGHTAQTGDSYARLGAPAGASVSADVAAVKVDTAATLADTGTDGVVVAAASKSGYALSSAGVQAIWDALTSALTTAGSIGKLLVDNINATISSRSSHTAANVRTEMDSNSTQLAAIVADTNELQTDWADGGRLDLIVDATLVDTNSLNDTKIPDTISLAAINAEADTAITDAALATAANLATVDTNVDAILADTADMQPKLGTPAGASMSADIAAVKSDTAAILVDTAVLETAMADSIPADGTIPSPIQALYMLVQHLNERSVSGTTVTIKKVDGSTSLYTLTLDDATTPTSITRAT